ncbi:hypothetical protein QQ045_017326 [Rhodiola kirilowii]
MKPAGKTKKLDALAKTPPTLVHVAQTPPRKKKGQPIKVEFLSDGTGLSNLRVCSLIVHEIGSVVRDKVSMLAPSFRELEENNRQIVYDHLYPNFVINPNDDRLWNFVFKRATERCRDWKSDCKLFYREHGPEVIPWEFLDRRDQWEWLKSHFDDPKNQINHLIKEEASQCQKCTQNLKESTTTLVRLHST